MDMFNPESLTAGRVPIGTTDPQEAAYHAAAHALDTENVHLISSDFEGFVYYLAAPSKAFSSNPFTGTTLAHALPGSDNHCGDAIYMASTGNLGTALVVIDQGEILSITSEGEIIENFISRYDQLDKISTDDMDGVEWLGYRTQSQQIIRKNTRLMIIIGLGFMGLGFALWLGLAALKGYTGTFIDEKDVTIKDNIDYVTKNLQTNHPMSEHLQTMHSVSSIAVMTGGWVNYFKIENNKMRWEIELPAWVEITPIYYEKLGNVVYAYPRKAKNTVIVRNWKTP